MAVNTPINAFSTPQLSDSPNITTAVATAINAIDARVNPIFASTAARDAAITSPANGMECYVTGTGEKYIYNGTAWLSGKPRIAFCNNAQTVTDSTTLTNSTFLTWSVEANCSYLFHGEIYIQSGAVNTNDFQWDFTIPAGASGNRSYFGQDSTASSDVNSILTRAIGHTTPVTMGTMTDRIFAVKINGWTTVAATPGSQVFRFAEFSAIGGVTSVSLLAGSHFYIWKVT